MKNSKEELMKLIQENPNLPFVFLVDNSELALEYGYSLFEDFRPYIRTVYEYETYDGKIFYDDESEILEKLMDDFSDDEKYENLTDEEYEKAIKQYIQEEIVHYKAIVVYIG